MTRRHLMTGKKRNMKPYCRRPTVKSGPNALGGTIEQIPSKSNLESPNLIKPFYVQTNAKDIQRPETHPKETVLVSSNMHAKLEEYKFPTSAYETKSSFDARHTANKIIKDDIQEFTLQTPFHCEIHRSQEH
ncbi:hypothetical protein M9H77_02620 [Catharanthus roseus]|uniref:Uncharacterized protein n=1 Tax=Catharanthus roseus TaxID=4058 RepID=A0ACC0C9C0_CATRO|nr:hypothetical protein M9H77_02620 [Catharanthus roseus]